MKFVYITDSHGDPRKYRDVLEFALKHDIKLIHLGGDILPKGTNLLKIQKRFVNNYLKDFYSECDSYGIKVIGFFGNDDIYTRKKYFRKYGDLLDEVPYKTDGYEFLAYPYVLDYPFGIKSACKLDYPGWKHTEPYLTGPCEFDDKGYYLIEDIEDYFLQKGTIEDDLKKIFADDKTIMAMHMPPQSSGMDVCYNNKRVGSKSVLEWIYREQPLLFLSGHIHESPEMSNIWKTMFGKTLVIQPGQKTDKTTMVYIDINGKNIDAQLVDI